MEPRRPYYVFAVVALIGIRACQAPELGAN